jgi:hypothetical protein
MPLLFSPLLDDPLIEESGPALLEDYILETAESTAESLELVGIGPDPGAVVIAAAKTRVYGNRSWSLQWTRAAASQGVRRAVEAHWRRHRATSFNWRPPGGGARFLVFYQEPPQFRRRGSRYDITVRLERPSVSDG